MVKTSSFAPNIGSVNFRHRCAISTALIGRTSPGESSIAYSAKCDPFEVDPDPPGPESCAASFLMGWSPAVAITFAKIISSGNSSASSRRNFSADLCSVLTASWDCDIGEPSGKATVALTKSASRAGKKINFIQPPANSPIVKTNSPTADANVTL